MKKGYWKTGGLALCAILGTATAASPAAAQIATFNLTGGNSASTGLPNSRVFYADNGMRVTAQAWSMTTSAGTPTAAYLGWYANGLGVTNGKEDGSYPEHTIDNRNGYDFVTLTFDQPVQLLYGSLHPYDVNTGSAPTENNAWVSFTMDPKLAPITTASVWKDLIYHSTEVKGNLTGPLYASYLNPGMNTGNIWVIGADRLNTSTTVDDGFKLSGFDIQIPTPEPASWALMIAGFGMVGAGLRSRRSTVPAASVA